MLQQTIVWTGMLGSYLSRKHGRPRRPTDIWRGFLVLHEIMKMYQLFKQSG